MNTLCKVHTAQYGVCMRVHTWMDYDNTLYTQYERMCASYTHNILYLWTDTKYVPDAVHVLLDAESVQLSIT